MKKKKKSVYPRESSVIAFERLAEEHLIKECDLFDMLVYLAQDLTDNQITILRKSLATQAEIKVTIKAKK